MRLLTAIAGIAAMLATFQFTSPHPPTDFAVFYLGGKLIGKIDIYSLSELAPHQRELGNARQPFIRPPVFALLMKPFGWLSFPAALKLWWALGATAALAFAVLWPGNKLTHITALCWSAPLWDSFVAGQDAPFVLLAAGAGFYLLHHTRYFVAGLMLSLCLIKFHLFLLLPLFLIRRRLWRTFGGLAAGLGCQIALNFAVEPSWLVKMSRSALSGAAGGAQNMYNFRSLASELPSPLAVEAVMGVALAGFCWWGLARRSDLTLAFAATVAAGVFLSHHAYVYDAALFLPLALYLLERAKHEWLRINALLVLATPVYFLAVVPGLVHLAKLLALAMILGVGLTAESQRLKADSR